MPNESLGTRPVRSWSPSGHCAMVACDIASFGDRNRTDHVQKHVRAALYGRLKESFDRSDVPFDDCYHEDRGDGVIVVIPPGISTATLVSPLVDRLRAGLLRHNQVASEVAQIRLRVALHTGEVRADDHGIVGTAVNHVFRLLEAPAFKEAFGASRACLGFLASEQVYEQVIRHAVDLIDPAEYRPVEVRMKETRTRGWMRLPGAVSAVPVDAEGTATGAAETAGIAEIAVPPPAQEAVRADDVSAVAFDQPAPIAEEVLDELPVGALFGIVDRLLDIPLMASDNGRDQVVGMLGKEIAAVVPRQLEARMDVYCILRTCIDYPEGFSKLVDTLRAVVGDSVPVRALEQAVNRPANGE